MMKYKYLILSIITIILEILPLGVVEVFYASANYDTIIKTHSYFSLAPIAYGQWSPLVTAVISCLLLFLAIFSINDDQVYKAIFVVSLIATGFSLISLRFGLSHYPIVARLITIMLAIECVLALLDQIQQNPSRKTHKT